MQTRPAPGSRALQRPATSSGPTSSRCGSTSPTTLDEVAPGRSFVVLGHGHGKSDAAQGFVERLRKEHPQRAAQVIAVGDIDLSAVDAGDIENAAMKLAGR